MRLRLLLTILLMGAPIAHLAGGADDNDGVLNGPRKKGGHRATHEGNRKSLELAIRDLIVVHGKAYPLGATFLKRLAHIESDTSDAFIGLKREALLANPALEFDRILLVRSKAGNRFARNWQTRVSLDPETRKTKQGETLPSYNDALVVFSLSTSTITPLYTPEHKFIGDVDLHWDGDRVLFSSHRDMSALTPGPGIGKGFAVYELRFDPATGRAKGVPRVISPDMGRDVDCFDACYLPDERIVFASTASYQGVPCVGGKDYVANIYRMDPDGHNIRRLTFDQDSEWHPTVMQNGRVMFTRWEYTDTAHYYSRVLMTMNPDGTDQKAFYGSNSYWPNSIFHARPIPGKPSMFVGTVSGHHDVAKQGPLVLFDSARGRHEADGAVQILTARDKPVVPIVHDQLTRHYSPLFAHPYPLDAKTFLAVKDGSIYLVDVFDNMLCLLPADNTGKYYEPLPLRKTARPYVQPDRIVAGSKTATVLINDIHVGPGLRGVPRGTVKQLRVYRYEYSPRNAGGHYAMGMESGWDAKQVLGTVPVESDGSAFFSVPANTPFGMQPLDNMGRALQLMRSWTVAMPGERLSCIGCHESPNMTPPARRYAATQRAPSTLKPFYGPTRGFGFKREIQPVLNKYCVGCHDGTQNIDALGHDHEGRYSIADRIIGTGKNAGKAFAACGIPDLTAKHAYANIHPYVRRNGPEGDYHVLTPLEFHANTSELFQMLAKGHHGVVLDDESWQRLFTWADLNAPLHATWTEARGKPEYLKRRLELRKQYSNVDFDLETVLPGPDVANIPIVPEQTPVSMRKVQRSDVKQRPMQKSALVLGNDVTIALVSVPCGEFSMGSDVESPQEQPVTRVTIEKPFQMSATEVTLRQFRQFDADYLNGVYDMHWKDQVHRGYYMNDMDFPVVRVSWERAMAYCDWLSKKTGKVVTLPTESEWEWACRAGSTTTHSYGDIHTDFSTHANFSDASVRAMAVSGVNPRPMNNPNPSVDYELKDPRFSDGVLHLAEVGSFAPNAWGLYDMHGNAAEWTLSDYVPYPYKASDGRNAGGAGDKVVRGGSWHDRPFRGSASFRLGFPKWQRIYHTGFRIVVKDKPLRHSVTFLRHSETR